MVHPDCGWSTYKPKVFFFLSGIQKRRPASVYSKSLRWRGEQWVPFPRSGSRAIRPSPGWRKVGSVDCFFYYIPVLSGSGRPTRIRICMFFGLPDPDGPVSTSTRYGSRYPDPTKMSRIRNTVTDPLFLHLIRHLSCWCDSPLSHQSSSFLAYIDGISTILPFSWL